MAHDVRVLDISFDLVYDARTKQQLQQNYKKNFTRN